MKVSKAGHATNSNECQRSPCIYVDPNSEDWERDYAAKLVGELEEGREALLATARDDSADGVLQQRAAECLSNRSESGTCHVKNVWDTGDGTIQIWHNGAAMIVERAGNARRYRCNDGNPNADFDDLIFRVVLTG